MTEEFTVSAMHMTAVSSIAVMSSTLGGEHLDKLLVVDEPVAVEVGGPEHVLGVLVGHLHLSVGRDDVLQLVLGDLPAAVLVERLERVPQHVSLVDAVHGRPAGLHQHAELGVVQAAVVVAVEGLGSSEYCMR